MIALRPYATLGGQDNDWLRMRLHFAAAGMGSPDHAPLGHLYVWNDDEFAPGTGFPLHPHREVEIVTYVRQGVIEHADSVGNRGRIEAGQVQAMSAGTGIRHTETSVGDLPAQVFQIWLQPRERGVAPSWRTAALPRDADGWQVLASGYGEPGALPVNADARLLVATLDAGATLTQALAPGMQAYLVPVDGAVVLNGLVLGARDGAAVTQEDAIVLVAQAPTRVVMAIVPIA